MSDKAITDEAKEAVEKARERIVQEEWVKLFLTNEVLIFCPRCEQSLITNGIYSYLEEAGVKEGRAWEIVLGLEEIGINGGFVVHTEVPEGGDPATQGKNWALCGTCVVENGVSQHENSKDWPIKAEG